MRLEEKLKELPASAGVYQYFDKDGHLLYVGKAKVLKNRVKSYFKFTPHLAPSDKLGPRIYKMISEVESLEYIVVPNEYEALILENSLIKQLKPKYNILLRDDKTYPYIYVDFSDDFPRLEITRKIIKKKDIKYFGPYSSGARDMLNSIYEIFPLVQKKSCVKGKKACLFHQIQKCHAPCEGKISKEDYRKIVNDSLEYLYNKSKLLNALKDKMDEYSQAFRFEDAMIIRDRIRSIERSEIKSTLDLANKESFDIFAVKHENNQAVVVIMFIRDGKLTSSDSSYFNSNEFDLNEAYERVIVNYYNSDIPFVPKEILIADDIEDRESLEDFLENKFSKKVKMLTPKIGDKKQLINIALQNCDELLRIKKATSATIDSEIKELFELQNLPKRVEAFDNSHMMGQATVGAMIVWEDNKFIKSSYRHYNLEAKDEYAQMREMLTNRVNSFEKNPAPDLWVIDGGKTLLTLAKDILESVGVNIDLISIAKEKVDAKAHRAKGKANDIIHSKDSEFRLKSSDKRLQFIQRLRDEAHRFAISFHKKQKLKQDKEISLLGIKGIGEAKVQKLLKYFGTFENIKNASIVDLKEVINEKDANLLFNYFSQKE